MFSLRTLGAVVMLALMTLCGQSLHGQPSKQAFVPPAPSYPPEFLPMGSRQRLIDWAVTNRYCTIGIILYYTDLNGSTGTAWATSPLDGLKFETYQQYKEKLAYHSMGLLKEYEADIRSDSTIELYTTIFYDALAEAGLFIETNLGPVSLITTNTFLNAEPTHINALIAVTNMQRFEISVDLDDGFTYRYEWVPRQTVSTVSSSKGKGTVQAAAIPFFPFELTKEGVIALNEWYSVTRYRARFTCETFDGTNTYTQNGERLIGERITMHPNQLEIQMPRGSETQIEESIDRITWIPLGEETSWSLGTNRIFVPIVTRSPQKFFRTRHR